MRITPAEPLMLLNVFHQTAYRYRRPVALREHRMRLTPRASHELRVLDAELTCAPAAEMRETEDVFGNKVTLASFAAPAAELVITNRLAIEQTSPEWPVFRIATEALSYPFAYAPEEIIDLGAMRTPRADPTGAVAAWAKSLPLGATTDTLSLLKDLNASILGLVAYRVRDEEGTQHPGETLATKSGSCRDIAALFIEAARMLGFGARAVSGYLYDPQGSAGDAGSTHAWAEVYLPEAGWIAFDPTHRRVGAANLIPTAVGRHNEQIMPILGSWAGAAEDVGEMSVEVTVLRAESIGR